jgi:hypothetical protein
MVKSNAYKILVAAVVCLSFIIAIAILNSMSKDDFSETNPVETNPVETNFNETDFPLEVKLPKKIYKEGDKISGDAIITNRSGKTVTVETNGAMPCTLFRGLGQSYNHVEIKPSALHTLESGDKISRVFEWEAYAVGTFILYVHYNIEVNGVRLSSEKEIIIEVR